MEDYDRVVHGFYEAATDPERWESAAEDLTELVGGGAVHLMLASLESGHEYVSLFARGDPAFADEYLRDYALADFRVPRVMARRLGDFADERHYVSADDERTSPIHQELLPRYGVARINGANMSLDGCIGFLGISAPEKSGEFDRRQHAMLTRISHHILAALRIARTHQELAYARQGGDDALDLVNTALFHLAGNRVESVNREAQRLLDERFFILRRGALHCVAGDGDRRLAAWLAGADILQPDMPLLLRDERSGQAYMVRCRASSPSPGWNGRTVRRRVVSVVELSPPAAPPLEEVVQFSAPYGVSVAEAMVLQAVLGSLNLAAFAEGRGVSLNTVQGQLKSALSKLEINSQKKFLQIYERYRSVT